MSVPAQSSQAQVPPQENKPNDKELNFRQLEAKYERQLSQERAARIEAEKKMEEARRPQVREEDDADEPYVDHKKLNKKLAAFGEQTKQQTQSDINKAVTLALAEDRKQTWLKNNGDFYDVLQHAEKLAQKDPDLAESILEMPESFERQKLVYKNIKALGLHKPQEKATSIQDTIDANRRSPYYQPSGVGAPPNTMGGDFSKQGQKQAYDKMQELKSRLRI
jgi:hypothetical protein